MKQLVSLIARRNNLYVFAWLAAIGLPWGMQFLTGSNEEVQSFMAGYYGSLSLFMFFGLTYGFATVFVSFYVISSLRRAGSLDMLRISGLTPREVVSGYFTQLQWIMVPPALGFMIVFAVYAIINRDTEVWSFSWTMVVGGALSFLLGQAALVSLMAVAMFRREYLWSLLMLVLVLPINFAPIIMVYALHLPMPLFLLLYVGLVWATLVLATGSVSKLWPAATEPVSHL